MGKPKNAQKKKKQTAQKQKGGFSKAPRRGSHKLSPSAHSVYAWARDPFGNVQPQPSTMQSFLVASPVVYGTLVAPTAGYGSITINPYAGYGDGTEGNSDATSTKPIYTSKTGGSVKALQAYGGLYHEGHLLDKSLFGHAQLSREFRRWIPIGAAVRIRPNQTVLNSGGRIGMVVADARIRDGFGIRKPGSVDGWTFTDIANQRTGSIQPITRGWKTLVWLNEDFME